MIGKMKKKSNKVHIVDMKVKESSDVEMADVEKKIKPKKRSMDSDKSIPVPIKKKAKIDKPLDTKESSEKVEKTEVKTHKQEAEEAKEKKRMRKTREKKFYVVREEVKKLWEELRLMDLDSRRRAQVTTEMFKLVQGKCVHFVFAHDTSRCVQSLFKFGTAAQKDVIFAELKGSFVKMMKSKFAKFCMRKLFKYSSKKQRHEIFQVFKGSVSVLLKHKEASEIVELGYNDYANGQQRNCMEEEFYGPTYLINKTPKIRNLVTFKAEFPDKMGAVIFYMKDKLFSLVEKSILQLSFVHKLLYDFFQVADPASIAELVESLKEHLPHLVHTRNGCRVAMRCLWFGTAKERKVIVKSLKTYVLKISQEEQGHMVLLALFDCVDDTRLVSKAILDEFSKDLDEVIENQFSRKVLIYLLSPRNPVFFHPDILRILVVGDTNSNSKKSMVARSRELLDYISPIILAWLTPNVGKLTTDNNLQLLLAVIVNNVTGDSEGLMRQVAKMVAAPFPAKSFHFIDTTSGHLVLKKMIGAAMKKEEELKDGEGDDGEGDDGGKGGVDDKSGEGDDGENAKEDDGEDKEDGEGEEVVEKEEIEEDKLTFAEVLVEEVGADNIKSWIHSNRGCFILVLLLDIKQPKVTERVKEALNNCKTTLKKNDSRGAQLLLKRLS